MAYRQGNRNQQTLLPASIEDYVAADASVRAYDAMIEAMDLAAMGFTLDPHKVGNSQYHPQSMLKLLVYGYSYGIRSSRKLERECHYNLSFIWLTGDLKPDHKTIAQFRRHNRKALAQVLKQCARLCIKLGLIEGNTLFIDGSKIRANASIGHSWTEERCVRRLEKIDQRIAEILTECDQADQAEQDTPSWVHMQEALTDAAQLRAKVEEILHQLRAEDKSSINTTDSECTKIHGRQGSHAGYNGQTVVDEKHGLIISSDVVSENNDLHQFARQTEQAAEILEKMPETVCADSGYSDIDELDKVDQQEVNVVAPSSRQVSEKVPGPFDKSHFQYDPQNDSYTCPEGQVLPCRRTDSDRGRKEYLAKVSICRQCKHFGICTRSLEGRKVTRLLKEELVQKLERQYEQPANQAIYHLRKQKVELPFGHIKYNLHGGHFLLRGLAGVKAEMAILASSFNIARMIGLMGVTGLISRLRG
jgi:transposase